MITFTFNGQIVATLSMPQTIPATRVEITDPSAEYSVFDQKPLTQYHFKLAGGTTPAGVAGLHRFLQKSKHLYGYYFLAALAGNDVATLESFWQHSDNLGSEQLSDPTLERLALTSRVYPLSHAIVCNSADALGWIMNTGPLNKTKLEQCFATALCEGSVKVLDLLWSAMPEQEQKQYMTSHGSELIAIASKQGLEWLLVNMPKQQDGLSELCVKMLASTIKHNQRPSSAPVTLEAVVAAAQAAGPSPDLGI